MNRAVARAVLSLPLVMGTTTLGARRSEKLGGVMAAEAATSGLDRLLGDLAARNAVMPSQVPARVETLPPGERHLAIDMLKMALDEAESTSAYRRRDAQSWLRDGARLYSARLCCDALGINYDAMIEALMRRWEERGVLR